MADLSWHLLAAVSAGPLRVLSGLWRLVSSEALWAARAEGRRPWVYPTAPTLAKLLRCCEKTVRDQWCALRSDGRCPAAPGWIVRSTRVGADGVEHLGWELVDPDGADAGRFPQAHAENVMSAEVDPAETCMPAAPVRPQAPAAAPSRGRASLRLLPAESCMPAADAAARTSRNLQGSEEPAAGGELGPAELLAEVAKIPTPEAPACPVTADPPTLERVGRLLAVPSVEGWTPNEFEAARRERFARVLAVVRAFAVICEFEPEQRRFWCGSMFETRGRLRVDDRDGPRSLARWEAVETTVRTWAAREGPGSGDSTHNRRHGAG